MSRSIVDFRGGRSGYRCGYCGSLTTKVSNGMWAHSLTVQDYQDLIDRGWRRSGKYVYKPVMDVTCCPQYAIRCEVSNFKLNKSHKKVMKRVNKYLNSDVKPGSSNKESGEMDGIDGGDIGASCDIPSERMDEKFVAAIPQNIEVKNISRTPNMSHKPKTSDAPQCQPSVSDSTKSPVKQRSPTEADQSSTPKKAPKLGTGADPNKPLCKKAKELRKERWAQKQAQKQESAKAQDNDKKKQNDPKTLEQFLSEISSNPAHRLEVKLVRSNPKSEDFERTFKESYRVFKKYQMGIHKEGESECDQSTFLDFLVNSPLEAEYREGGADHGYGSFHQQYWLDGRLICVGVLDILPKCVSSVYLYYDPEFFFLSPGTYSALREIEFTKQLHQSEPSILYYYLGYYIHSCPKMRYKGQYVPSFLCCPETYRWHRIEECRNKLDVNKFSRFAELGVEDENEVIDINMVMILHQRQAMPYAIYKAINPDADSDDEDEVRTYSRLAGRTVTERMLLYRQ